MKKILLSLIVLLAMLAGTSCKKDKPASLSVLEQKILGKWTFVQSEIVSVPDDPANAELFIAPPDAYVEIKTAPNTFILFNGQSTITKDWLEVDDTHFSILTFYVNPSTVEIVSASSIKISTPYTSGDINFIETITLTKP
jgi:hypothetical protein